MSEFNLKQLISGKQLSRAMIDVILQESAKMETILEQEKECELLKGKIVAALFYEPSTRTRLSFETATLRMGGKIINAIGEEHASFKKGETLYDTIKTIENYADILVMRHSQIGSAQTATQATTKPFLNAGDGAGEHPTQALLDLFTIQKEQGQIDELTIGFLGDLKYGRTVHSLAYLLSNFKVKLVFISPQKLSLPEEVKIFLKEQKIDFQELQNPQEVLPQLDILYVTRVQKERFEKESEYHALKDVYRVNPELIQQGKATLSVLHPLPRVREISPELDNLPQAAYFKQVKNSVPVRMALLNLIANH